MAATRLRLKRPGARVVPFRGAKVRVRGEILGAGRLEVGPRWSGGFFSQTHFIVQKGGTCTVEENFRLMTGSSVIVESGGHLELASGFINSRASISCFTAIKLGAGAHVGPDVVMLDSDSHTIFGSGRPVSEPIVVGENVWIGARAIILKGVTIGAGSVVAAGSVVTKDVAPGALVAGSPARYVKDVIWTP